MASLRYRIYDCMTDYIFGGSSAALIDLDEYGQDLNDDLRVKITDELKQPITCFYKAADNEKSVFDVQSFNAKSEVWLINHGLIAVAKNLPKTTSVLKLQDMEAKVTFDNDAPTIFLPRLSIQPTAVPDRLSQAINATPVSVHSYGKTFIIEMRSAEEVRALQPNVAKLLNLPYERIAVTAEADDGKNDYVCRYFMPKHARDESNGSLYLQTMLAPFWAEQFQKTTLNFCQLSERKSFGCAELSDHHVAMTANAVLSFQAELYL